MYMKTIEYHAIYLWDPVELFLINFQAWPD